MGAIARILKVLVALAVTFCGYYLAAAEGWPSPLDEMQTGRRLAGGLIILLGLIALYRALRAPGRVKSKAEAAGSAGQGDPFALISTMEPTPAGPIRPLRRCRSRAAGASGRRRRPT